MKNPYSDEDRKVSLAHWDGLYPPPAAIRCPKTRREEPSPNTSIVSGCLLLVEHKGLCDFGDADPPSYLPMQPREAPRIPDLCPDDTEECTRCVGSAETAFGKCNQCAGTGRMATRLP